MEKIKNLQKLGVCVKAQNFTVEYQNSVCEKYCGKQLGKICDKGCIIQLRSLKSSEEFKTGFKVFRNVLVDKNELDCVVFEDGDKVVSLLLNSSEFVQQQLENLKKYNLSKAEIRVMRLFLQGSNSLQIAAAMFISKSTVRTHLNNIYKKIPDNLKSDVLARHFGHQRK